MDNEELEQPLLPPGKPVPFLQETIDETLEKEFGYKVKVTGNHLVTCKQLVDMVGVKLATEMMGLPSTRVLHRWIKGQEAPHPYQVRMLRNAWEVASIVSGVKSRAAAREWLKTANPHIAGFTPASTLSKEFSLVRDAAFHLVSGREIY